MYTCAKKKNGTFANGLWNTLSLSRDYAILP